MLIKDVIGYDSINDIQIDKWNDFYRINYAGSEYLIYDKSDNNSLAKLIKYSTDVTFILIYKNMKEMKDDINNLLNQRDTQQLLQNSITVFDSDKNLEIELEGFGENYLEYKDQYIQAKQYRIKLVDLLNLYDNEGDNIFKANVRKGIHSNVRENASLKNSFKESFARGLVKTCSKNLVDEDDDIKRKFVEAIDIIISDILKLNMKYEEIENNEYITSDIKSFYHKHNGVTVIASQKDGIIYKDKFIILNNKKIQVINGAQTITKWYDIIYDVDNKVKNIDCNIDIKKIIDLTKEELYVKTSFLSPIDSKDNEIDVNKIISEITLGLNTQLPVTDIDIFINKSQKVIELNMLLSPYGIRIAKSGENSSNTVLIKDLVQSYYVFMGGPGEARNLSLDAVVNDKTIEKIIKLLKDVERNGEFIEFVQYQPKIEQWWKKRNNLSKLTYEYFECSETDYARQVKPFIANGLFHFKAFLKECKVFRDIDLFNEDIDEILKKCLKDVIQIFRAKVVKKDDIIDSNLFKGKDREVFEKIKVAINEETQEKIQEKIEFNEALRQEMQKKYFAIEGESSEPKNKNYRFINEFLKIKGVIMENVRTIAVKNGGVKEAFPFSTNTFKDISISFNNGNVDSFEESTFLSEISKSYNLFVIDNENKEIKYKTINFKKYLENANYVYNEVIEAFKQCNEDQLPSSSQNNSFHIRPKAIDSKDLILFSYDKYITKRTFWANKATMNDLLGLNK